MGLLVLHQVPHELLLLSDTVLDVNLLFLWGNRKRAQATSGGIGSNKEHSEQRERRGCFQQFPSEALEPGSLRIGIRVQSPRSTNRGIWNNGKLLKNGYSTKAHAGLMDIVTETVVQ